MARKYFDGSAGDEDWGTAGNWSPSAPIAGDDVEILADAGNLTLGLDQSALGILSFTRQQGHSGVIGNGIHDPLILNLTGVGRYIDIAGTGNFFLDVGASDLDVLVRESGQGFGGGYGLILTGTSINLLNILNGNVFLHGATCTDIEILSGLLFADRNCTLTDAGNAVLNAIGGQAVIEAALDDIRCSGAEVTVNGAGTVGDVLCDAGTCYMNNTGLTDKAQADSEGTIDFRNSTIGRTVTDVGRSGNGQVILDPDVITVTNAITSDGPVSIGAAA